jgi:hypothetical protein
MLFRVILLPAAFSSLPPNDEAAAFFYPAAISILQDLSENCIILIDSRVSDGKVPAIAALHEAMKDWPEQFKIRAQKVLTLLEKKKRFQVISTQYTPEARCTVSHCQHALGIAAPLEKDRIVIMAGGTCLPCSSALLLQAQVLDIRGYPVSEFSQKRRQKRAILLSDGQWSSEQFEQFILSPVLRYAEVLKLYDRLVTRAIDLETVDPGKGDTLVPENYRLTLEWIISVFARESKSAIKRVEIYSAVSTGADNKRLKKLEEGLQQFVDALAKKTGVRLSMVIKEETQNLRMPHGRYLITDKIGLLVERGFDLLWDDRTMARAGLDASKDKRRLRDVMVSICPDPDGIETAANRLRNARVLS